MANVVCLEDFRTRRMAAAQAAGALPVQPVYLAAEPGKVVLAFSDGAQLDLSPEHARIWAERLAAMADTAEAMGREGGDGG